MSARHESEHFSVLRAYRDDLIRAARNEWDERNHLEPCQRRGRAYLEATREAPAAATASRRQLADGVAVSIGMNSGGPK